MMKTIKLFGVAGSGKTTACLQMIKYFLGNINNNVPENIKKLFKDKNISYEISDICFCSFTRAAIKSIKQKLSNDNITIPDVNYIKTLHSLTWYLCGYDRDKNILKEKEKIEFFEGINIRTTPEEDEPSEAMQIEDLYNGVLNFHAKKLNEISDSEIRTYITEGKKSLDYTLDDDSMISCLRKYDEWKIENNKKTFVDSLIDVLYNKLNIPCAILIVDEAQDLTRLQTKIIDMWIKDFKREYFVIAGDDDQTVHEWAGAYPEYLVEFKLNNMEKIILEESHRVPVNTSKFCNDILKTINYREQKIIWSKKEKGKLSYLPEISMDKLLVFINELRIEEETNFFLFRTNKAKNTFADYLFKKTDIPFSFLGRGFLGRWSFKFIKICNALNKLDKKENLSKYEVIYLFNCLPTKTCLIYGVKTKVVTDSKREYTYMEVLGMTKLWKEQKTLSDSLRGEDTKTNIKERILKYISYDKSNQNNIKIIAKNELYMEKFRRITKNLNIVCDDEKKTVSYFNTRLGTFHASKGLEATNVFVFLGTSNYFEDINDSERRCFYTACSRTAKNEYLIGTMEGESPCLEEEFKYIIMRHTQ